MIDIVENNIYKIREACEQHHVALLQLFGSAARENDFTDNSDLDFLVRFHPFAEGDSNTVCRKWVENFDRLHEKLQCITQRKVDVIEEHTIKNKYLRYFISKDTIPIYGSS